MNQERKICQNCKIDFQIESEDFGFYEKMKVPPPTWCSQCRLQRRLMFRNERNLYKGSCALTGKSLLTMYAPGHRFPVYTTEAWWSDEWDSMRYGQEYDFSRTFFDQFVELRDKVPRPNLAQTKAQNSEYANYLEEVRNVYLSFSAIYGSEDVLYSKNITHAFKILDGLDVNESENCYEMNSGYKNYNCKFILFSENCIDSSFMYDSTNCRDCFGCVGLRNKSYHIFNQPYSKEEYQRILASFDISSYSGLEQMKKRFFDFTLTFPRKYARIINCNDSSGDDLVNNREVVESFSSFNCESVKFGFRCPGMKDSMDVTNAGGAELVYEFISGGGKNSQKTRFTTYGFPSLVDTHYTDYCSSSSYLFGCIGLRNKKYCILNKQYSEREYNELVPRIIDHMNSHPYVDSLNREYRYGEFLPPELSLFTYNESVAQEYFPLTKERALELGYRWRDREERNYAITMSPSDIPDRVTDIDDSIFGETIGCEHAGSCSDQCTAAFKIVPQELEFYRRMNLPLPHLCPNCRHYQRLKQRNPLTLWHRGCDCAGVNSKDGGYSNVSSHIHGAVKCSSEFETSYAPSRPEIVYCEACYQSEVI